MQDKSWTAKTSQFLIMLSIVAFALSTPIHESAAVSSQGDPEYDNHQCRMRAVGELRECIDFRIDDYYFCVDKGGLEQDCWDDFVRGVLWICYAEYDAKIAECDRIFPTPSPTPS